MKTFGNKGPYVLLILLFFASILPFIYISRYVHPVNDDFTFALRHVSADWLQSVVDSYRSWSGRYFATAVSSLNPYTGFPQPLKMLRIYSAVLSALMFAVPVCAGMMLTGKYTGRLRGAALGALFGLCYMALCPSASQLLFWFSSYTAFTLCSLLALVFFSILSRDSRACVAIQGLLAFLIPGGNEVTAVLFVSVLAYLAYTYRSRRLVALTLIACVAVVIVILSPGNAIRMTYQLSSHPRLWAVTLSFLQTCGWCVLWLPSLMIASLVYVPLFGLRLSELKIFDTSLAGYFGFALTTVFLAHIPPTYGLSSVMIDRTANSLLVFFILLYFWGLNIFLNRYAATLKSAMRPLHGRSGRRLVAAAFFVFTFTLPFNIDSPVATAVTDIVTGKARKYSDVQTSRLEEARLCDTDGTEVCRLSPFGITSRTLFVKDLDADPDGEFSTDYCKVNGLKCKVSAPADEVWFESNFDALKHLGKKSRKSL